MKTYARILQGEVVEIIGPAKDPDGNEIPIEERFAADFVEQLVDVTNVSPMPDQQWKYDGETFSPPASA
ncbi:hypothetical protein [Burkholderia multivorans]|uniref:hypothetical protein n=1 Tax=Burkholderia multivorans TaxID=87883 RepID=UPI001C251686|nr:hypothetical protein [Burkholderia multivorans]MBU9592767.1 hypothetical protein [Burkholderia multivorans]